MVKLDILSDPVCPWCYIGKAHLDRALSAAPEHPFVIEWHPFQLNPDLPREGVDRDAYLGARMGGPAGVARALAQVAEVAKAAGLAFNNHLVKRIPNTLDAHRLIHWAGIEGRQTAMVSALFRANFVEARDIGQAEVLAEIAAACGMDGAAVARALATDADLDLIRSRDAHSRKMGVRAVPTFLVDQSYAVEGAQPPELWANVIAELAARDTDEGAAPARRLS